MKILAKCFWLIILALALCSLPESTLKADENTDQKSKFIDLDGDGIDDNAPDRNNDGIPNLDKSDGADQTSTIEEKTEDTEIIAPIKLTNNFDFNMLLSKSEKFGKLKFTARAQTSYRGGFDSGDNFGPGNGIGIGAVSGCPGGVCH